MFSHEVQRRQVVKYEDEVVILPKWINPKDTLMILCGQELVAFRTPEGDWKVKQIRCDQCGECCLDTPDGHTPFGSDDEGKCNALEKEGDKWLCTAGARRPFRCLPDPKEGLYDCCIRYY